ncbi:MAG TPA: phospholipase D family protein [Pseudomonas sp.]|nr:phospholipase D family protein [Pseudomonas sp.]
MADLPFWRRWVLWGGCAVLASGCSGLPALDGRTASQALSPHEAAATALGRALEEDLRRHPGLSGILTLQNARDAFAARVLLARSAERSLDVQYYIWRQDITGTLLFEELHAAADRGVRVRLLLDDHNTRGLDSTLAALDAHPNIEVRLFNPFPQRRLRVLGFLTDFPRVNRRMHNKSFTADGQATILGGRNVGDEYFGATDGVLFADLDALAVGPVVRDVAEDFDRYWNSGSSYPLDLLVPAARAERLEALARRASLAEREPAAARYVEAIRDSAFIRQLLERRLALEWVPARLVSDDPGKGLGLAPREALLPHQLREIIGEPRRHLELVSPYFVPTGAGVEAFAALVREGIEVRVLTNALEATDVALVHSGYAKRRRELLEAGVRLYEMRRSGPHSEAGKAGLFGSSASSLHAKTFAVDEQRVFIGSFNFDPRSTNLNTELGLVIESPRLAGQLRQLFERTVPAVAYEVRLDEKGREYWLERDGPEAYRHHHEPGTGLLRRAAVRVLSWLPIDWLL